MTLLVAYFHVYRIFKLGRLAGDSRSVRRELCRHTIITLGFQ